MVLILSTKSAY